MGGFADLAVHGPQNHGGRRILHECPDGTGTWAVEPCPGHPGRKRSVAVDVETSRDRVLTRHRTSELSQAITYFAFGAATETGRERMPLLFDLSQVGGSRLAELVGCDEIERFDRYWLIERSHLGNVAARTADDDRAIVLGPHPEFCIEWHRPVQADLDRLATGKFGESTYSDSTVGTCRRTAIPLLDPHDPTSRQASEPDARARYQHVPDPPYSSLVHSRTDHSGTSFAEPSTEHGGCNRMGIQVSLLSTRIASGSSSERRRIVELAEESGLDGVGVGDHVSFFTGAGNDGLIDATSVLTASDHLSAVVGVYLLPLRHPVPVARQLASIAAMAPGRLTLGVGIGGEDPHEVEICGVDPRTRGKRMDECLAIIRGLLTGESLDFDGEFFQLDQAIIAPAPAEPIPILVGGRSDAAIRRAGRLGDGWFSVWASPERYAKALEQMQTAADEAGRGDVQWHNALNVWCGVGPTTETARSYVAPTMEGFYQTPYERFEKWSPAGPPNEIAAFLAPYVEAGCHTFNIIACGASLEDEIQAVGEIRTHLVP